MVAGKSVKKNMDAQKDIKEAKLQETRCIEKKKTFSTNGERVQSC